VTGVLRTDDAQYTLAADDLAVFTSGFDGGFDFHRFDLSLKIPITCNGM
jgi:hypothetical protein